MWEVIARSGDRERRVITCHWDRASGLAKKALDCGWKVRVKTYFADVLVGNCDGDFVVVRRRVKTKEAFAFHRHWFKNERDACCILWPHGLPIPSRWRVVD